jgi:hypothetical protein
VYCPNSELCKTIFSNKEIKALGNSAATKAYTVVETSSTDLDSGKATETTYSITYYLCSLSSYKTMAQTSISFNSTKYLA